MIRPITQIEWRNELEEWQSDKQWGCQGNNVMNFATKSLQEFNNHCGKDLGLIENASICVQSVNSHQVLMAMTIITAMCHLFLKVVLNGRSYYFHIMDVETKDQKVYVTFLKLGSHYFHMGLADAINCCVISLIFIFYENLKTKYI